MNKIKLSIFFTFYCLTCFSQSKTKGYYITLNNDTIQATILYYDILELQKKLQIITTDGESKTFHPNEIKGFVIKKDSTLRIIDFSFYSVFSAEEINLSTNGSWGPSDEISVLSQSDRLNLFDSLSLQNGYIYFQSHNKVFLKNAFGENEFLQIYEYYFFTSATGIKFLEGTFFTYKQGKYIPYPTGAWGKKNRKWLSELVSDYSLLSSLIERKNFPINYKIIIDSYNEWRSQKKSSHTDTLVVMRGIFDAKKYYKATKIFWPTFIGSSFFILPGGITGLIIRDHIAKHHKIKIPEVNPKFMNDEKYKLGYISMAMTKNQQAVDRGVLWGAIVCFGVIVPIIIIASP
jgi:hypothetical protein